MKKLLALLLAAVMVLGMTACGSAPAETTAAPAAASDAAETTAAETTAAALDPVNIKIWFHGSNVTPEASAKVMEQVNAYLKDKINVTVEPIWGTWGDFDTATVTALAGGDDVDIYFTCNWSADEYNKYARDGYWVKLDDLLPKYAADIQALIPEGIWDCAKTNGYDGFGIYALPALKDTATQNCWDVNGTLLADIGYDVDKVCADGLDYFSDEFEEMLKKAKEYKVSKGETDFYPLVVEPAVLERMVTNTAIVTGDLNGANVLSYYFDPQNPSKDIGSKIINKYGSEEFKKFAERTYYYAQQGYISPSTQNVGTSNDYLSSCQSSASYLIGTQSYAYGYEATTKGIRGIDVRYVPVSKPFMDATSGQGAMMAISATSKNPERALMFLNLLNTDPTLMTMMNYGLEGVNYTTNSDGTISFIDDSHGGYWPWRNGMGNIRILPPTEDEGVTYWDDFAAYYDSAEALPYGGYIFDSTNVKNEGAALANVYAEYAFNLMSGATNPDSTLPEFLSKLESAGIDAFVAEANRQLDEYLG